MTAQAPDVLLIDGEEVPLFAAPLNEYLSGLGQEWPFATAWTSSWRGYVATWTIDDDRLFLLGLEGWAAAQRIHADDPMKVSLREAIAAIPPDVDLGEWALNPRKIPLTFLFADAGERVAATWFTGVLRVPRGKELEYVHMGFESVYEEYLVITIEQGRVARRETVGGPEWLECERERLEQERSEHGRAGRTPPPAGAR